MTKRISAAAVVLVTIVGICMRLPAEENQQAGKEISKLRVGRRAAISSMMFACGSWRKLARWSCPAVSKGGATKIAVYARRLNDDVLRLAKSVDGEIERDKSLKWSFVDVLDWQHSVAETQEERTAEHEKLLENIADAAAENEIRTLTLGLARGRWERESVRLGMDEERDVLVTLLGRSNGRSRTVIYLRRLRSSELDDKTIDKLLKDIKIARADAQQTPARSPAP